MQLRKMAVLLGMLVLGLTACAQKPAKEGLTVVATVNFYGEVAQAVLGDHGHATSVIDNPDIDPHDYEPTTNVAKTVADADVVIQNGAGYDSWIDRLVAADGHSMKVVSAAKVVGLKDGDNEHIWYKPSLMPELADALATQFGKLDPKHKQAYKQNAAAYIKKLKVVDDTLASLKQNVRQKRVAVSEPVFDNALAALGYRIVNNHFAQAVEEGTDPSPQDIRELEADISHHRIAFFVQNKQADSKIVTNIVQKCRAAGIPVLKVTETMPSGDTYITWMQAQYRQLQKIQLEGNNG